MLEFFGITTAYLVAAIIAACVRLLVLSKQPPPPRPTLYEMFRQAALTFIFVAAAEPVALLVSIDAAYATVVGIAVALHGTDQVACYIKKTARILLPNFINKKLDEIIEDEKKK
ncbi:hypothetical protein HOP61_13360 [Halomonas daqingensis]|uniref:Uncharacterized protein n=1 Tax=Billgrantia desiderata TaxID=52021 RepID=A0AAW4YXA4_9GAMM|nr:hypothetical protein [Halomonas desiderata]MCE8052293.1 hypothetical protein [Halomonas desiderata]